MKYQYSDSLQITPHFNSAEFRCKCGKEHEFNVSDELVQKLEQLYAALNCSKIIVTSGFRCSAHDRQLRAVEPDSIHSAMPLTSAATGRTDSRFHLRWSAAKLRISGSPALPISQQPISTHTLMCVLMASGMAMKFTVTAL